MPLAPDDLAMLRDTRQVRIETRASDGSVHRTIIWIVAEGEDVFVRSYRGAGARWYREALRERADIIAGSRRLAVTVVPATDPDSVRRASEAILTKYAGDPAAKAMVRPEILETTLRLEPA